MGAGYLRPALFSSLHNGAYIQRVRPTLSQRLGLWRVMPPQHSHAAYRLPVHNDSSRITTFVARPLGVYSAFVWWLCPSTHCLTPGFSTSRRIRMIYVEIQKTKLLTGTHRTNISLSLAVPAVGAAAVEIDDPSRGQIPSCWCRSPVSTVFGVGEFVDVNRWVVAG